jgi:hypothetical protein
MVQVGRRPAAAEKVNGAKLGEHLVEILSGSNACADVRIKILASHLRYKRRDLLDKRGVKGSIVVRSGERSYSCGLGHKRSYGGNDIQSLADLGNSYSFIDKMNQFRSILARLFISSWRACFPWPSLVNSHTSWRSLAPDPVRGSGVTIVPPQPHRFRDSVWSRLPLWLSRWSRTNSRASRLP